MDEYSARRGVSVLIADKHRIFREGLRCLLEATTGFVVVGEAGDGVDLVALVQSLKPDVLLLDLDLPQLSGLDILRELKAGPIPIRPIVLTAAIGKEQLIQALQWGARGVVLKESSPQLLFKSIRSVMAGQYWVGRDAVSDLVHALDSLADPSANGERKEAFGLTPRELQVLAAIVAGYTNKDVAQEFSVSEDTVKHHLTNIFNKLGVSNRLELALFAIHHRLLPGPHKLVSIGAAPPGNRGPNRSPEA